MVNRISDALSAKMANMSFFCACLVVLLHCSPAPVPNSFNWWFCHMIGREGLCVIAVPYFFFVAGFFLSGKYNGSRPVMDIWRVEVLKRVRSLIIPFVIWMVITAIRGYVLWYLKANIFHVPTQIGFWGHSFSWQLLWFLGIHPFADIGVLWFVRCLFALAVVAPMLVWLTRFSRVVIAVLSLCFIVFLYVDGQGAGWNFYFFFDRYLTIRGCLWFFLGTVARQKCWRLPNKSLGVSLLFVGIFFLILKNLLDLRGCGAAMNIFEATSVPFLIVGIFTVIPSTKWPGIFVRNSFPIFLAHNAFLSLIAMILMALNVNAMGGMLIPIAIVRMLLAIALSIFMAEFLKNRFPRFANILYGGR